MFTELMTNVIHALTVSSVAYVPLEQVAFCNSSVLIEILKS